VLSVGVKIKKEEEVSGKNNAGRLIIIDESLETHRQPTLGMRKVSSSKLLIGFRTGRNL
jgi:hypothetical protein